MFISADFLGVTYGVDDKIARFFADREPPLDNLYWKGKLLYLRPSPGYLFIPLIVDLLFKLGIDRNQLLSNEFVSTMEMTGHISALEETGQITKAEAIKKCIDLVEITCKSREWFTDLSDFFNDGTANFFSPLTTPFRALHRGDIFLFSVCALQFPEELNSKIAEQWFALISTLLLLDDADDIETDRESGDENAFLESGLNIEGLGRISDLVSCNTQRMAAVNRSMARELNRQFQDLMNTLQLIKL